MAWPPLPGSTTYAVRGGTPTTIAWGTDGIYPGVIVLSMRNAQMIEEVQIPNGTGLTSNQVVLNDGDSADIEVIDDRSITFPASMQTISLLEPLIEGGTVVNATLFQVIDNDYSAARKQEGRRHLLCKRYTLIVPS